MHFLEAMASGNVLYGLVGAVALSLFIDVVWKDGAKRLLKTLLSPLTWLWGKLTKKAPAATAEVTNVVTLAADDAKKAGNWLTNSRFWKWLAGHDYDPGKHSWLWWTERLGGLAIILVFSHWYVYGLGVASTPPATDVKALTLDLKLARHSQITCQKGWDKCERDFANVVKTDPPSPPLDAPTLVDTQPQPLPVATVPPLAKPKPVLKHKAQKFMGATAP